MDLRHLCGTIVREPSAHACQSTCHRANDSGRGVGRRLLDLVVILARSAGAGKLTLFVYEGNAAARRLYERYGFVTSANERAKASPYGAMLPMKLDFTSTD
jgi:GNAT superfamily N-acetyltransferase